MSMMRFETICLFIAVLLNVWNLAYTGTFSGCFYIDNRTDAVSFYCKESTGTYPKVTCLSLFFGNSSWEANRSAIKSLKLSECKGTDLNRKLYKTFTNLREFDVSFYGVQSLNSEALHLTYLERFNASHNRLTSIGGSIFYNSPNVKEIDFSYNKITKLFASDFIQATKLTNINFSHNEIYILGSDTFRNLTFLETLDLSSNLIRAVNKDQFNSNLTVLRLENNPIIRVDCRFLEFLMSSTRVQFSWANVKEIDKSCSGNLVKIDVNSKNDIVFRRDSLELTCAKEAVKNWRYLNISGNQLHNTAKIIELLGTSIETLDVSFNFVGKLNVETLKNLNNLQYLNLSSSNLSDFNFKTFYNQRKLVTLDLSYNHLKKADFTLFVRNFKNLKILNLEGNDLTEVDTITRSRFPKLTSLGLSKNNFSCRYLANFLLQWENLSLFDNPSDQTHIDGVDCYHNEMDSKENERYDTAMDLESSAEDGNSHKIKTVSENIRIIATEPPAKTSNLSPVKAPRERESVLENTSNKLGSSETDTIKHLSHIADENNTADFRVVERVFLMLCIACCGLLVLKKTTFIQSIRQKLAQRSSERNIAYQRGSQDLSFIYSGVTTL